MAQKHTKKYTQPKKRRKAGGEGERKEFLSSMYSMIPVMG